MSRHVESNHDAKLKVLGRRVINFEIGRYGLVACLVHWRSVYPYHPVYGIQIRLDGCHVRIVCIPILYCTVLYVSDI